MPEGDTILRLAARITDAHAGQVVTSSIFRHPRLATIDLSGRSLVDATSHGKHLFLNWDDHRSLHVHLLMQGRVHFGRSSAENWRRRFEINFHESGIVGVDIPLLHMIPTNKSDLFTGHLGPDLCGTLDLDLAVDRLSADPDAFLSAALLDQRNASGFGNIYAVEVPYICGISPFTPVGDIEDFDRLVAIGAAMIRTNAHLGPQNTTGRRLHTPDQWILGTKRKDCPICGSILRRMSGQECPWKRRTIWCEQCQSDRHARIDLERAKKLLAMHPARHALDFDTPQLYVGKTDPVITR